MCVLLDSALYLKSCKFRPSILTHYHLYPRPPVLLTRDSRNIRVNPGTLAGSHSGYSM
ncbi:hypothetical protein ASZ90_016892 [hydrocarbon metagenome]|uniref:Uncharacterized protein n=1 Tax=hydrocarbon metagenome TaxID=938273 RepID=A0A0W8EAJ9_9ZZZZ